MKQKTRIIIYIAIALTALALGIIAVISAPESDTSKTADEFINAGNKYLIELSYDKAVIEFNKAIEIEPRNADAYIGLAEAYLGIGDKEKAVETLELGYENTDDERIKEMLDELIGEPEETTVVTASAATTEVTTNSEPKTFIDEMVEFYIPCSEEWSTTGREDYSSYYGSTSTETDKYVITLYDYNSAFLVEYKLKAENIESTNPLSGYWSETPVLDIRFDDEDGFKINNYIHNHIDYPCNVAYPAVTYYDESGNLVQRAENEYNKEKKLVRSIVYDADGTMKSEIVYEYDDEGKLTRSGNKKEFTYDENGNLIKEIVYNDEGEESYLFEWKYNSDNNPLYQNCSGALLDDIEWEYDSNGNLISINVDNGDKIITYNSNGNMLTYNTGGSNNSFEYNSAGQCVKHSVENKYSANELIVYSTWTYTYDSDGQVNSCDSYFEYSDGSYEGGMLKEFQYDSAGRVIRETADNYVTTYEYDSEGRLLKAETQRSYSNETVQYTYGAHGKLTEILCEDGFSAETYSYKYMKIALPSIFVEQIKNEYGIDIAA